MSPSVKSNHCVWEFAEERPGSSGGPQQILSSLADVSPAVGEVIAAMAGSGYLERDLFEVSLALGETLLDALKQGDKYDPTRRTRLRYRVASDFVLVEVENEGENFDSEQVSGTPFLRDRKRTSKGGLSLMRQWTTWSYLSERGNRITFCKCRADT